MMLPKAEYNRADNRFGYGSAPMAAAVWPSRTGDSVARHAGWGILGVAGVPPTGRRTPVALDAFVTVNAKERPMTRYSRLWITNASSALIITLAIFATLTIVAGFVGLGCGTGLPFVNDGDFLSSGRTLSHFQAFQVDPTAEDSAGPQFVVADDIDADGLTDLVSAWNQSQPVQIHLQRRTESGEIRFETTTLAGSIQAIRVAGLSVADFDGDGRPDISVLIKESGLSDAGCLDGEEDNSGYAGLIVVYFGPTNPAQTNQALAWEEMAVGASLLAGKRGTNPGPPEEEGFTSMSIGDMDNDGDMDLIAAINPACSDQTPEAVIFTNAGRNSIRNGTWGIFVIPDSNPKGALLSDQTEDTRIKDIQVGDVDGDGDLDVVASFPAAGTLNVRWYRNPTIDVPDDFHLSDTMWQVGLVGQVEPRDGFTDLGGPDILRLGDLDGDGILDVVVRSSGGKVVQWLKGPEGPTTAPLRHIPWRVYTIAEFLDRVPEAIALGDMSGDGRLDLIAAAVGGIAWFESEGAPGVNDQWIEHIIIDDLPPGSPSDAPATTDPNVEPTEIEGATFINALLVVDLDGDGRDDVVATLDRSGLSGLSNDALAWLRNTRR